LDLLVFQSLFPSWHKISRVPHIRGWVGGQMGWDGWGGRWAKVALQTQWDQLLWQMSHQWSPNHTTRQNRPSDNSHGWPGETHTNATLLKPAKHCYSVFRALQGHEKAVWKSRPGYLLLFYCVVWIVHEWSYKVSQ